MNIVLKASLLAGVAVGMSGCDLRRAGDEYPIDVDTVFAALNKGSLAKTAWPQATTSVFSRGNGKLTWRSQTRVNQIDCKIDLTAIEENGTKVALNCGSGPTQDTTIVPMTANEVRQRAIEVIDATLTGRPVDLERKGQTAYLWPDNKADLSPKVATPAQRAAQGSYYQGDAPPGWYD